MLHVKSTTYYIHKMQNYGVTFKVSNLFYYSIILWYAICREDMAKLCSKKKRIENAKQLHVFAFFML